MKNLYLIIIFFLALVWWGCSKQERLNFNQSDAPAPAQVTNVKATANPGGATLTYTLPKDPNLSYVKAVYEIQPGVMREAKSSIYSDTLALVGFGDTKSHEVKVYSIGKNEKASDPVTVTITPLTPPVNSVFGTLTMNEAFGGVTVTFTNDTKADISVELMIDTTGKNTWKNLNVLYTAAATGKFSVRGMASVEKRFGVLVRDRWNNISDTLIKNLTPKFEIEIPKTLWKNAKLPTDLWKEVSGGFLIEHLWDNQWSVLSGQSFATPNGSPMPQWFTIDLGQKVLMSRFKEHQAPSSHLYVASAVKRFELWGSNNPPADGSFNGWDLLGTFESYKPSGVPLGTTTAEDKNYGNFLGEDFDFVNQPAAYRYIRFKTLETYSSTGQIVIAELTLFGEVQP